ncbi:MAG: cyclic nucleotide-binding domain-containing protein [Deltaproteobacteria bacterium]|nr:cyclic nucleotide-binding domain-containing protein [Deltaproteobacteria bacterium]
MRGPFGLPLRAPRLTIAVLLPLTAVLGAFAAAVRIDSAVENLLPANDPERDYYEQVKRDFGSEEATVVAIFADDVFAPPLLARIDDLTQQLASIDGVREAMSVTNVKGVEPEDGSVRVGRLMRALPRTPEEVAPLRARMLKDPLYAGNIVSTDGRATGVIVLFEPLSDEEFLARGIEDRIRALAAERFAPAEFAITGIQTFKVEGARLMERDLQRFVPLSLLLVIVVLALEFRTWRGVLLPLGAVVIGVVWTVGVMVLAGSSINMGTLILPPLLMAIGIAYAVHVVSRYYLELADGAGGGRVAVVEATVRHIRAPSAIAWLTTSIGCITLAVTPIPAIRDFGIYSALGVTFTFLVSLTFVPAMLLLLPDPRITPHAEERGRRLTAWLASVGSFGVRRRREIMVASAIACAIAVWGATKLEVETDYLSFFGPSTVVRQDNDRIARQLGGAQPVYLVLEATERGRMRDVATIAAMRDLQQFVGQQPGVDSTFSLADYVMVVRRALDPESPPGLPDQQRDIDQLLLFADPTDLAPVVTRDWTRANIVVRTRLSGSAEISRLIDRIVEYANEHLPGGLTLHPTGSVVLLNRSADTLARGQAVGLSQELIVLLLVMSALFLSFRTGLLSLVPNVVPILALFAVMGFAGIDLNISTAMIAAIALGIAIDDTIHYFNDFKLQIRETGDVERAIINVVSSVGRPIVFTAAALCAAFLILCLSSFEPIRQFGVLASFTMVIDLIAELLITPGLVVSTTIITLWDLLFVRLGQSPHREIPLFAGLRPFQARIVVLMGRLRSAPVGTFIARRGELKAEMYVLLRGRVDVLGGTGQAPIRSMGRGDALGEMGLVRAQPRSADVVVVHEAEYLVLDEGFLQRLQVRHPRIAAKVFLNLTRILSDRLERTTDLLVDERSHSSEGTVG